eukprot:g3265.t1
MEEPPDVHDAATLGLLDGKVESALRDIVKTAKRIDFLDALHHFRGALQCIPLPESKVDAQQARKDTRRENVVLNGVQFMGESKMRHFTAAIEAVALSAHMNEREASAVCERVLCATSRTVSGADSYFILGRIFELPGLLLKPRSELIPPVRVDMRGAHGVVQCKIMTSNLFGLYRRDEIEQLSLAEEDAEPAAWVMIDAVVTEQLEFSFGEAPDIASPRSSALAVAGRRILSIDTPEPEPTVAEEVNELF